MFARREILVGDAEVIVAGGMESMTNAPYLLPKARSGYRMGNGQIIDSMIHDGLWDPYDNMHMGNCGDAGRREVRLHARGPGRLRAASFERALAGPEGRQVQGRRSCRCRCRRRRASRCWSRRTRARRRRSSTRCRSLQARLLEGRHGDGGERLVDQRRRRGAGGDCSAAAAKQHGFTVLARIVGDSTAAVEPKWFTIAPVARAREALREDRRRSRSTGTSTRSTRPSRA